MAVTVEEASARYENFMVNPAPPGPGVCSECRGIPSEGYTRCYGCSNNPQNLDAFVPITYSVHLEQMHTELRGYKESDYAPTARARFRVGLTAVLWRFLLRHESCVARAAGVDSFEHVVTVPSRTLARDNRPGGLRAIVGELCGHTCERYVRALLPTDVPSNPRVYDPARFRAQAPVDGSVLLIDDTWVSGSHVQSAAQVLRDAGASTVGCVVIGRHVHRGFASTDEVLAARPRFDWGTCAAHEA